MQKLTVAEANSHTFTVGEKIEIISLVDIEYSKCVICGIRFEHPRTGKRGKPRIFCSNACKCIDYRRNKKNAQI